MYNGEQNELALTCERVMVEYDACDLINLIRRKHAVSLDQKRFFDPSDKSFSSDHPEEFHYDNDIEDMIDDMFSFKSEEEPFMPGEGSIPDDVQNLMFAAYSNYISKAAGTVYLNILRDSQNLIHKALICTTVEAVFKANQLPEGSKATRRAIEPLTGLLIERHGSIDSTIYQLLDNFSLSKETYGAFIDYAEEIKVGDVMPDYKKELRNITKKDFVNILALKFFYDSMNAVRKKREGKRKTIRKIDTCVNAVARAAMNHLGIKPQNNYLLALKKFIFKTPSLTFMSPEVHKKFLQVIQ